MPTSVRMSVPAGQTTQKISWGYLGDIGPDSWGTLKEDWALCGIGKRQSPIELSSENAIPASGYALRPQLQLAPTRHLFMMRHQEANPLAANKSLILEPVGRMPAMLNLPDVGRYRLSNAHFHTGGSEHVLNKVRARMECHFVFTQEMAAAEDTTRPHGFGSKNVVISVMISSGDDTTLWLRSIFRNSVNPPNPDMPDGGKLIEVNLGEAIPNFDKANFYSYDGSLTIPPGTEGVHHIVMAQRAMVTEEDCIMLEMFQGGSNTRPLQAINGRPVVQFPEVRYRTAIGA